MTSTELDPDARQRLIDYLDTHHIPAGLGTDDEACSLAAINLALTGRLTDEIPKCMSLVVGQWILRIQDAIPDAMRNSAGWKALLPDAAGTGRALETQRLEIIMGWMWGRVLPQLSDLARAGGFGPEWQAMLLRRNSDAVDVAYAARAAARVATYAADAAVDAVDAADAATDAAYAAGAAADAVDAAVDAVDGFWAAINPVSLLAELTQCDGLAR